MMDGTYKWTWSSKAQTRNTAEINNVQLGVESTYRPHSSQAVDDAIKLACQTQVVRRTVRQNENLGEEDNPPTIP